MEKKKPLVERIPDPELVRLYKAGQLSDLVDIEEDPQTRNLTLKFSDGRTERRLFLKDIGWVADAGSDPCAK